MQAAPLPPWTPAEQAVAPLRAGGSAGLDHPYPAAMSSAAASFMQDYQERQQIVQLQHLRQLLMQQQMLLEQQKQQQEPQPACGTSNEWASAVLSVTPYLDQEKTKEALAIMDEAVRNIQTIKSLDGIVASASTGMAWDVSAALPALTAAEHMKAQVLGQQQALLCRLHSLPSGGSGGVSGCAKGAAAVFGAGPGQGPMVPQQLTWQPLPAWPDAFAWQPPQEQDASSGTPSGSTQTLATSLQMLSGEDPECLFIVRRINKLGFKSAKKLRLYFSECGRVVRVLLAHSTIRKNGDVQEHCSRQRRPSSLGFVQMATPEAVRQALALGDEQTVEGSVVLVQRFEPQRGGGIKDGDDEQAEDEEEEQALADGASDGQSWGCQGSAILNGDKVWKRQQSSLNSTSANGSGSASSGSANNGAANGSRSASGSASSGSAIEGSPLEEVNEADNGSQSASGSASSGSANEGSPLEEVQEEDGSA